MTEDNRLFVDEVSKELNDYLLDLLEYGLARYKTELGDFKTKFKIYVNYYKDQIRKELLMTSFNYMKGTIFDSQKGSTYCYVRLKRDKTKLERTNYKDKLLSPDVFQWECEKGVIKGSNIAQNICNTKNVYL